MTQQERLLNLIVLLIPLSLLAIALGAVEPVYLQNPEIISSGWTLLIHKGFNATFWWPLKEWAIPEYALSLLVIAVTCMISIASMRGEDSPDRFSLIVSSLVPPAVLFLLFGPDQVTFAFAAQLGTTLLSCLLIRSGIAEHLRRGIVVTVFTALLLIFCSNQLSPYLLLALGSAVFATTTNNRHSQLQLRLYLLLALLTAALALVTLNLSHRPSLPDFAYPASARVVPDDGVAGNILPLLGETTTIPFINRPALKETLHLPATLLFLASLLTLARRVFPRRSLSLITVFISTCLAFDTLLPDTFSTLAPLETIRRIMPGIFPLTLLPACCALMVPLLWVITARSPLRLVVLLACMLSSYGIPGALNGLPDAFSRSLSENSRPFAIAASPSLYLLRQEGIATLDLLRGRSSLAMLSVAELDGSITTSHHKKLKTRKLLSDGRMETRWSPRRGAQYGDEWILIELPTARTILGIQALPGKYFSDFPRALMIENCQPEDQSVVREIQNWQGGLALTTSGYPYYTGQHDVSIQFAQPVTTRCIKLKQTAENPNFDWSIAELRLLVQ